MKSKISWKTILAIIVFAISTLSIVGLAFSAVCPTWTGVAFLITDITVAGYSFMYLDERYERLFK